MRGVVADQLQRARIVAAQEFDFGILVDGVGEVGDRPVERHRDGPLGQRGGDRFGDVEAGNPRLERPARAVGESDVDHARS